MKTERKPLGTLAILALAALLISAVALAVDVDAAKGGKGGGGGSGVCHGKKCNGGGDTTTGTVMVTPNPVPLGSQSVDISGTGFRANEYLVVSLPGACCDIGATTDASGAFSVIFYRNFDWPSTYTVEVQRNGVTVATTTFTVV